MTETDFPLELCEENIADVEGEEEEEKEECILVVVLAIVAARGIAAHLCCLHASKRYHLTSVNSSNLSSFLLELYIRAAEKDAVDDRAAKSGNCGLDYRVN